MDRKEQIYELQEMLRTVMQDENQVSAVNPDGIFGVETEKALLLFQKNQNLPMTGKADYQTWQILYRESVRIQKKYRPVPVAVFPSPFYKIGPGETGDMVRFIQMMMKNMETAIDFFNSVSVTGIYDGETQTAVLQFQKLFALPPTGEIGVETWNGFATAYNQIVANTAYTN